MVEASASRAGDPGFDSSLRWDISCLSHTSDLKIGTPVATQPGVRRYRASDGTGWPVVSVHCDWVRYNVRSATSISVRQDVKLSEQIRS